MKKISSVNRDRISRMYVDRKINVNQVSTVGPVDAVKPVHNEASSSNENFLLFAGSFYDKFLDLREQYRDFYLNQRDLEDIMEKYKNKNDDDSLEEIITTIQELVEKYNKTIISLKNFESKLPGIGFSQDIHHILLEHQMPLNTIGITIIEEVTLNFNPSNLRNNINFHPNCLYFLFDYQSGLVRQIFTIFRNIKVTQLTKSRGYTDGNSVSPAGMLINEKR